MLTRAYNDKSAILLKNESKPKRSFLHGTDIIATALQNLQTNQMNDSSFLPAKTIFDAVPMLFLVGM